MSENDTDALLTSSQRAFLNGETDADWGDPTGRATRSRIRQRVQAGLQDFEDLAEPERFDERDLTQMTDAMSDQKLRTALEELIAFVYRLQPDSFEAIVDAGTRRGVTRIRPEYDVGEVQIPIEKRGYILEQAREQMAAGKPLTETQVLVLLEKGDLPAEELQEYVRAHPTRRSDEYRRRFR